MLPYMYLCIYVVFVGPNKLFTRAAIAFGSQGSRRKEEEVEDEEDINLLNYCCDHNFNDTKIKKPLRPQSGGGNIIHKRGKWSGPTAAATLATTKASGSRWQWLPEKFPLNLLTIFASHKLCHTHTNTLSSRHTHTK